MLGIRTAQEVAQGSFTSKGKGEDDLEGMGCRLGIVVALGRGPQGCGGSSSSSSAAAVQQWCSSDARGRINANVD